MRISDWSSDVCSSDLPVDRVAKKHPRQQFVAGDAGDDQFGMGFPGCLEDDLGRRAGFDMDGDVDVRILAHQIPVDAVAGLADRVGRPPPGRQIAQAPEQGHSLRRRECVNDGEFGLPRPAAEQGTVAAALAAAAKAGGPVSTWTAMWTCGSSRTRSL